MQRVRAFKIESHDEVECFRILLAHYGQPFPHQLAVRFPHVVKRILSL
jgi:hypothetical protein